MAIRNALGQFTSAAILAEERRRRLLKMAVTELLVADVALGEVESLLDGHGLTLTPMPQFVRDAVEFAAREGETAVGAPIFEAIFGAALPQGVLGAMQANAPDALAILERIIGFTVGLPFGTTQVHAALKALLGEHAPEALLDAINKLPAELGMNFFIPQVMANVVDVATGVPLREAIAEQTRPFRLEWPQLRQLARLHALDATELNARLRKVGVREQDLPLLDKITQQLLPVGDLQQAYLAGIMDEPTVRLGLEALGFTPEGVQTIVELYLHRAETAGGDQLRVAAQEGFLLDHLTEDQYRAILAQVHVPAASIDLEVEASTLRKSWTNHKLTVAEIKALTLDGQLTDVDAVQRLQALNYSPADAGKLVQSWHKTARASKAGLTVAHVLAYQAHGVLTEAEAYDYLIGLNIRPADARLLVAHPTLAAPVAQKPLTQATVIAAYLDDIIDRTKAEALLVSISIRREEIDLALAIADDKLARGSKVKAAHRSITEAQVIDAFKLGLASDTWATRELVTLGYSEADALLLVAIEEARLAGAVPSGWTMLT
jgi:hypothetical protein